MMMDGVPGVRAAEKVRPLSLSGKSTQPRGGDRRPAGAGRGHQLKCGQGTRTTHLGGHPLIVGDRHRQGGIAELTQGCDSCGAGFCAPPPGWGSCRCGRRVWPPAAGSRRSRGTPGALRRLEHRPPQLRAALARQIPRCAFVSRGVHGDIEPGETHQLIGTVKPAGIADLGPHDRRAQPAHPGGCGCSPTPTTPRVGY
jgi:hypothetical protein